MAARGAFYTNGKKAACAEYVAAHHPAAVFLLQVTPWVAVRRLC